MLFGRPNQDELLLLQLLPSFMYTVSAHFEIKR